MRERGFLIGFAGLAAVAAGGCHKAGEWFGGPSDQGHGRYSGIGIYDPGPSWRSMVAGQPAKDTSTAQLFDDSAVIVVVDSITGEVRGCGNMTGYCVGMNPWKAQLAAGQIAPVPLIAHTKTYGTEAAPAEAASDSLSASH